MPDKVIEVTLCPVDAIHDWDIPTQVPKFIQNSFEDTNIMHARFAFDKGGIDIGIDNYIQNRFKDTTVVYAGSVFDKGAIFTWSADYINELDLYETLTITQMVTF